MVSYRKIGKLMIKKKDLHWIARSCKEISWSKVRARQPLEYPWVFQNKMGETGKKDKGKKEQKKKPKLTIKEKKKQKQEKKSGTVGTV